MAYLIERKSQTIFVTATSIIAKGKPREMIVESRPEYAVVQLSGVPEEIPSAVGGGLPAAKRRHKANLRLEVSRPCVSVSRQAGKRNSNLGFRDQSPIALCSPFAFSAASSKRATRSSARR